MRNEEIISPDISFVTVDFHKIRVGIWRSKNPLARPILYFNGIGGNLEMAAPFCEKVVQTRDIITFDVPGCGESSSPKFPYRMFWIARLASKILRHYGFRNKVDVFGISWGGMAAQQFALQYSRKVHKLILAATGQGTFIVPGNMAALTKMTSNTRFTDPDYLMRNYEELYGESSEEIMRNHCVRVNPPTKRGYYAQLMAASGWTGIPYLPFLKTPTLIMAGDRDRLVPLINARFMHKLIPNSRLEIIKNGGHLFIIARSNLVTRRVIDFLDKDANDILSAVALPA